MRLIDARGRYEPRAKFTTWLYTIAHNRLMDHFRASAAARGVRERRRSGEDVRSTICRGRIPDRRAPRDGRHAARGARGAARRAARGVRAAAGRRTVGRGDRHGDRRQRARPPRAGCAMPSTKLRASLREPADAQREPVTEPDPATRTSTGRTATRRPTSRRPRSTSASAPLRAAPWPRPQSLEAAHAPRCGAILDCPVAGALSVAATVVVAVTLSYMVEREDARLARVDGLPSSAPPQAMAVAPAEGAKAPVPTAVPTPDLAQSERAAKVESTRADAAVAQSANLPERATAEPPPPAPAPAARLPGRTDGPAANGMLAKEAERRQAATDTASPASPPPQTRVAPHRNAGGPCPRSLGAPACTRADGQARAGARPRRTGRSRPGLRRSPGPDGARGRIGLGRAEGAHPGGMARRPPPPEGRGTHGRVRQELAEFRKRFPDYQLPADLSPLT